MLQKRQSGSQNFSELDGCMLSALTKTQTLSELEKMWTD